jgi:hypothetical protein
MRDDSVPLLEGESINSGANPVSHQLRKSSNADSLLKTDGFSMYSTVRWKLIMPATPLSMGMVFSAFGQSNPSASNSMSAAGDPMKQAGSDIADLTRHTHENAVTVLRDPKITVKVKAALDEEGGTEHSDIRVHTTTSSFGMPLEVFDNE